jgi:hypothetical protein
VFSFEAKCRSHAVGHHKDGLGALSSYLPQGYCLVSSDEMELIYVRNHSVRRKSASIPQPI